MDYRYIEQLLERYFAAETTLEEEHILREFFAQESVPAELEHYRALFAAQKQLAEAHLTDAFDQQILQMTGQMPVQARRISLLSRMSPLLKAAAVVAFAVIIGTMLQRPTRHQLMDEPEMVAVAEQDDIVPNQDASLDVRSAEAISPVDTTALGNALQQITN